jgi:uncharacterized protein
MTIRLCSRALPAATVSALILLISATATGQTPKVNDTTPLDSLKAYCDRGNSSAMIEFGERMLQGKGIAVDTVQGIALLQKAANAGNTQAWYELGVVYANNIGVKTNMPKAMACFRKGAELKNADCQTSLGLFYQAGEKILGGVKADPAEARKWYTLAAEQGHQEAMLHLGQLLVFGQGGDANPVEGADWFRKGAELGNPESQWSLGQCYLQGKGLAMDSVQAYGLFAAAADGAENPQMKKGMTERTEALGKNLSEKQLSAGKQVAAEWKSKRR